MYTLEAYAAWVRSLLRELDSEGDTARYFAVSAHLKLIERELELARVQAELDSAKWSIKS